MLTLSSVHVNRDHNFPSCWSTLDYVPKKQKYNLPQCMHFWKIKWIKTVQRNFKFPHDSNYTQIMQILCHALRYLPYYRSSSMLLALKCQYCPHPTKFPDNQNTPQKFSNHPLGGSRAPPRPTEPVKVNGKIKESEVAEFFVVTLKSLYYSMAGNLSKLSAPSLFTFCYRKIQWF